MSHQRILLESTTNVPLSEEDQLLEAFKKLDVDSTGSLGRQELTLVFRQPGSRHQYTHEEAALLAKETIEVYDTTGDGRLKQEEFIQWGKTHGRELDVIKAAIRAIGGASRSHFFSGGQTRGPDSTGTASSVGGSSQSQPAHRALELAAIGSAVGADVPDLLTNAGVMVDDTTATGDSLLYAACERGATPLVQYLVERGAEVDWGSPDGILPLTASALHGYADIFALLLHYGAQVNQHGGNGSTPLCTCCAQGVAEGVALLLVHGADPNLAQEDGYTPLYICCGYGWLMILPRLILSHANPNLVCGPPAYETPLSVCASYGELLAASKLLEARANANVRRGDGATPLFLASQVGHAPIVRLLLTKARADAETRTNEGVSPLAVASEGGHLAVVLDLVRTGIMLDDADRPGGPSVLSVARWEGHVEVSC